MPKDTPPIYEPFAVQEIFVDGFSDVLLIGETFRCTAFSLQPVPGVEEVQPVPVGRLIMPTSAIRAFMDQVRDVFNAARKKNGHKRKGR